MQKTKFTFLTLAVFAVLCAASLTLTPSVKAEAIPNLVGSWSGQNLTISQEKGYRTWKNKTVHITEQKGRRFKGSFTYEEGTKNFVGVIFPDNSSFAWVSTNSKGYNLGRILGSDHISACYVEATDNATAGCAEMLRVQE